MDIIVIFNFSDVLARMKLEALVGPPTGMKPNGEKFMHVFWTGVSRRTCLDFMNAACTIEGILALTVKHTYEVTPPSTGLELVF